MILAQAPRNFPALPCGCVRAGGPYLHERLLAEPLVDLGPVGDVFGPLSVVQRAQSLLQVAGGRRHGGDDGRLGAAAQRVLQQPRQLGLPEEETDGSQTFSQTAAGERYTARQRQSQTTSGAEPARSICRLYTDSRATNLSQVARFLVIRLGKGNEP